MSKQYQVAVSGETYAALSKIAKREHRTKGGTVSIAVDFYAKNYASKKSEAQKQEVANV